MFDPDLPMRVRDLVSLLGRGLTVHQLSGLSRPSGEKGERLALLHEQPEHLGADLIDDLDSLRTLR